MNTVKLRMSKLAAIPYLTTCANLTRRGRNYVRSLLKATAIPATIRTLETLPSSPKPLVDFVFSNPIVQAAQVYDELLQFAQVVADLRPRAVLEIGTCYGGTLCVLTRLADPNAIVISVDLPGGRFGGGYDLIRRQVFRKFPVNGQQLHLLRANSHLPATGKQVRELLQGRQLDLLFIDGDHTYDGVKADFENYSLLVRSGGTIAFHDIVERTWGQVPRLWGEIKTPSAREIIADPNQGWAGIGIDYR